MDWLPVGIVIALAMGFNYTNGFHDAANAIATSVSTRALTPRVALVMAAVANLLGGLMSGCSARSRPRSARASSRPPTGIEGLAICAPRSSAPSAGTC